MIKKNEMHLWFSASFLRMERDVEEELAGLIPGTGSVRSAELDFPIDASSALPSRSSTQTDLHEV